MLLKPISFLRANTGGGGSTPTFIGLYGGSDSVTLTSGKTYAIAAAGYSANMTSLSSGSNTGTIEQEHSFSGRRACLCEIVCTTTRTGSLTWSSTPGDFALYEVGSMSFNSGLNGGNGDGGPNLSINTNSGDVAIIAGYEFGDRAHTWPVGVTATWRKGDTLDGLGAIFSDNLNCAGGTPQNFHMDDNGAGLVSCIGVWR